MRLDDLIAGQPFRAALRMLFVFLLVYLVAGWGLVRVVSDSLRAELLSQAHSEVLLLEEIYESSGLQGLTDALQDLRYHSQLPERAAGMFGADHQHLAGPIAVYPDFVGVVRHDMQQLTGGVIDGSFFLIAHEVEEVTLVVGRSTRTQDVARARLIAGLLAFGLFLSVAILFLGLWASRTSLLRLQAMEASLRGFASGDSAQRLPVLGSGDQFDRVSIQMNGNLDKLEGLMVGMKSTASAIAHDLKTPLSHTQIKLHEAADACEMGADPMPRIEDALAEIEAMNGVFDAVLRISRIQASNRSSFVQIDLPALARTVVEFMSPLAEENNQSLQLGIDDFDAFRGDPGMIQQALVNLVNNAITHAGPGTDVYVSIEGRKLAVRDTGGGVPEADRAKLLQPFTRADAARSTPGSGLGLALVKAVADHHNAELSLRNMSPGFVVEITFPSEQML